MLFYFPFSFSQAQTLQRARRPSSAVSLPGVHQFEFHFQGDISDARREATQPSANGGVWREQPQAQRNSRLEREKGREPSGFNRTQDEVAQERVKKQKPATEATAKQLSKTEKSAER